MSIERLKFLYIVRGGAHFGRYHSLTETAVPQVMKLGQHLAGRIGLYPPLVIYSPMTCTAQTGTIIAHECSCNPTWYFSDERLYSGEHDGDLPPAKINQKLEAVYDMLVEHCSKFRPFHVVIVTHYLIAAEFPQFFLRKHLQINIASKLIGRGEAWRVYASPKAAQAVPQSLLQHIQI